MSLPRDARDHIWHDSPEQSMTDYDKVSHLAQLLERRNRIEHEISSVIDRPSHSGHIGEFVAAGIFGIDLFKSATHKGADGRFTRGSLAGR